MAEQAGAAVVGEVITRTASFITNKMEQLFGVSEKVKHLEFKIIKICSVIEESKKYDIDNRPLLDWQRQLIDAVQEGECLLRAIKNRTSAATSTTPQSSWKHLQDFVFATFASFVDDWKLRCAKNVILNKEEIERLNRSLERLECISTDIGLFLELIRMQKRRRNRRRRYRPYPHRLPLVYLRLGCLVPCDVVVFVLSVPSFDSPVEIKKEIGLKTDVSGMFGPALLLILFSINLSCSLIWGRIRTHCTCLSFMMFVQFIRMQPRLGTPSSQQLHRTYGNKL